MKLSPSEIQSFTLAQFNTYDLKGLEINKEVALKSLNKDFIEEINDLNRESTKKARHLHFKVKGTVPNDYAEKRLILDHEKSIIYGIRNMGANPELPFINLIPNFEITSKEIALSLYENIKEEFKAFSPLYLSFHTSNIINADFSGSIYMVAKTEHVKEKNPWPMEEKLSFSPIHDDSYYDWYQKGYEQFHKEVPALRERVTLNSKETMAYSLSQGLLKFIEINGERIGLIAAEKSQFLGHSGLYFNEIFITKEWKGKGIAKAIQLKFIQSFVQDLDYIWGTIDSANLPSYRTAQTNGRRPIRYEAFINLK